MVDPAFRNKVQVTFKKAIDRLKAERNKLDNVRFDKEATQLANDIADALGIRLAPEYLKLSMLSASPDNIKNKTRAQEQLLLDFNKVRTLTVDDLSAMKDIVNKQKLKEDARNQQVEALLAPKDNLTS